MKKLLCSRLLPLVLVLLGFGAAPAFAQLTVLEEGGTFLAGNFAPAGVAFAKDVLPGYTQHSIPHLNDGVYGNANSWISNSDNSFAGINLGATAMPVNRIAFGRDNLAGATDRSVDLYTIQYTTEANPNETTTTWTDIGMVDYRAAVPGVTNTGLRHLFSFPTVNATGIRIVTLTSGTCIDEIELGYAIPGAATDITLTATSIKENNAAGATIGTLSATGPDMSHTYTFSLSGGLDDAAFTITGNTLTINGSADYETKASYSIRIRATDDSSGALTFDKNFTITVINVGEQVPRFITETASPVIPDHSAPGYFILKDTVGGTDAGTNFIYSVLGADAAAFTVTGNTVTLTGSSDFATKQSYTFTFRATNADNSNLFCEKSHTFAVQGPVLDVQFNDTSIAYGASGVNVGVQFPGDTTTFVLKNNGLLDLFVTVFAAPSAYTVTAVGSSGGGIGSGSGSSSPSAFIAGGQTAFVTLTYNGPYDHASGQVIFDLSGVQESRTSFTYFIVPGSPHGETVVNDTFTATSGVTVVAPLANDGSPEVTITRVVGGNATIAPDGRHLIIAAGFTGTLTYVTSYDAIGTVTIVAGSPVETPTKWLGLLHDTNGKIVGQAGVALTGGKYTAALNVGHVRKSAKFSLGTATPTALGSLNATLDGANHLQVTLGTNTGDLRPLVATGTAAKFNAKLEAMDANLLGGGYANLEVKKTGMVKAKGTLPDGTKFSTASTLADDNSVLIYTPAIATKPKGTVAGQMAFATQAATDVTGELSWVKPQQAKKTGLNASGVDAVLTLNGCIIVPADPPTDVDNDTNLIGANFSSPVFVSVRMTNGKAARKDPIKSLIINGKTGALSGTVIFPSTNKVVPFKGVFLPKTGRSWGFIKGDTAGGRVDAVLD